MSDDLRTALLSALTGGNASGASVEQLVASLSESDPTTALLARYLADRHATAEKAPESVVDERAGERQIAFEHLRTHVTELYAELEALRVRNEQLAAAMGACSCWGDEPACSHCGGAGVPGWSAPDVLLLRVYALPALRELVPRRVSSDASRQAQRTPLAVDHPRRSGSTKGDLHERQRPVRDGRP